MKQREETSMRNRIALALAILMAAGAVTPVPMQAAETKKIAYPQAARGEQVDDFHGTKVPDPYRWLEDPDAEPTRAWINAENEITQGYLKAIPEREAIRKRLTEAWNYERYRVPFQEGGRYFFSRNDGLQNQNVFYWQESLDAQPKVLLDPNKLSQDGTIALTRAEVSEDGKLVAYGLSSGGSDWEEWKVREVETGRDLPDHVRWVKFSGAAWSRDGKGFYYSRYAEPSEDTKLEDANYNQKLYYHRLGTAQSEDELVYQRPDNKELGFIARVTEDGRYLAIHIWQGTEVKNGFAYRDLSQPGSPVVQLLSDFDAQYGFIGNDGPVFWFQTNQNAPRNRVVAIDVRNPARENWREVIPQAAETLEGVSVLNDTFVTQYLKDAHSQVRMFSLDGKPLRELELPGIGSVQGFEGERKDTESFYGFVSFTNPGTIYRYDFKTGKSTIFRQPKIAGFNPNDYETRQVFYKSKDGTRVPMFITHKKGLKLDGNNPTYLYGYGGFASSMTPYFSLPQVVWMERGGVFATPSIRGGGEYGHDWHQSGIKLKKQNGFDDFIAAAEWLIENRYTSKGKLAIGGHSNGGLLTAASMVQRPDLFGAVLVGVGVLDMLRFHKFTIGWGWVSDYGSPDNPEEFKAIYAYSPYHNLKPGTSYPPTLITTADHDDRVVPAHSFKFAAALQHAHQGPNPVLIRIETRAGHGGGKPTSKRIEEAADELSFFLQNLNREAKPQQRAGGR
jgi:prolyl oligopeptidase